jgi:hypothetical protein
MQTQTPNTSTRRLSTSPPQEAKNAASSRQDENFSREQKSAAGNSPEDSNPVLGTVSSSPPAHALTQVALGSATVEGSRRRTDMFSPTQKQNTSTENNNNNNNNNNDNNNSKMTDNRRSSTGQINLGVLGRGRGTVNDMKRPLLSDADVSLCVCM